MATKNKRVNGEGSWGERTIRGSVYTYFAKSYEKEDGSSERKYFYARKGRGDKANIKKKLKQYEEKRLNEEDDIKLKKREDILSAGSYVKKYVFNYHRKKNKKGIGIATKKSYMESAELFEKQQESMIQVPSVKTKDLEKMFNRMAPYYSEATLEKLSVVLNLAFEYAENNGDIKKNPMESIEMPDRMYYKSPLSSSKNADYLIPADVELFYNEAMKIDGKGNFIYGINALIAVFILYSGARVSEAVGLQIKHLHNIDSADEKAWFNIRRTVAKEKIYDTETEYHYEWVVKPPKNDKSIRSVPFSKRALKAVKMALKEREKLTLDSPVFVTKSGTHPERTNILKTVKRIEKNAGCSVTNAGTHKLRHSFGSFLLEKGFGKEVDIGLVSELLGHSSIEVTAKIYIHYLDSRKFRAISLLD